MVNSDRLHLKGRQSYILSMSRAFIARCVSAVSKEVMGENICKLESIVLHVVILW